LSGRRLSAARQFCPALRRRLSSSFKGRGVGAARIYKRAGDTFAFREAFECCPPVLPGFEKKTEFVF
ncbi:MAG: hypothetical protein AAFU81_10005, partial [Pseudomonadota bacterium]